MAKKLTFRWWWGGLGVLLLLLQFIPVNKENPPAQGTLPAPPEIEQLLRKSCLDCHSHQTRWPWYSHLAPISFLVAHDVNHGREYVNLSLWDTYDEMQKQRILLTSAEEIEKNRMPPASYSLVHPEAKLSESERTLLVSWLKSESRKAFPPADRE